MINFYRHKWVVKLGTKYRIIYWFFPYSIFTFKLLAGKPIITIAKESDLSYNDCCVSVRAAGYKLNGKSDKRTGAQ
jgi:hypothetical protein